MSNCHCKKCKCPKEDSPIVREIFKDERNTVIKTIRELYAVKLAEQIDQEMVRNIENEKSG